MRIAVCCLVTLTWLVSSAVAQQAVRFVDGRTLEVEHVALRGSQAFLSLEGGGSIAVPVGRIARVDTLEQAVRPPVPVPDEPDEPWRLAAGPYAELIADAASRHEVDPVLLTSMARVESSLDSRAVSHKGAAGLLQLMPATARRFGVNDVFDVSQNVEGGARYLSWLLDRYEGRTDLALAGYNAGEGAVDRHRGIPPYKETEAYVSRVLEIADRLNR